MNTAGTAPTRGILLPRTPLNIMMQTNEKLIQEIAEGVAVPQHLHTFV